MKCQNWKLNIFPPDFSRQDILINESVLEFLNISLNDGSYHNTVIEVVQPFHQHYIHVSDSSNSSIAKFDPKCDCTICHSHPRFYIQLTPESIGRSSLSSNNATTVSAEKSPGGNITLSHETVYLSHNIADVFGIQPYKNVVIHVIEDTSHLELDLLELTFSDQYLSRSEMWRIKRKVLIGNCVYLNKCIEFCHGSVRLKINEMWKNNTTAKCGIVTENTRVVFRSPTAIIYLFIQMSSEMWDFDSDGYLHFEKAIDGFLNELFDLWLKYGSSHEVTIVLFSRVFYKIDAFDDEGNVIPSYTEDIDDDVKIELGDCVQYKWIDDQKLYFEDFYFVVVQNERFDDWSPIITELHKIFSTYKSVLLTHHLKKTGINLNDKRKSDYMYKVSDCYISSSDQGNFLEVYNMALNTFENTYLNRNLDRTGQQSIVISPGSGVFEVDRRMANMTKQRVIDCGAGSDLICIGAQPFHAVPLLKFTSPDRSPHPMVVPKASSSNVNNAFDDLQVEYSMPHWINISFYSPERIQNQDAHKYRSRIKLPHELTINQNTDYDELNMINVTSREVSDSFSSSFMPSITIKDSVNSNTYDQLSHGKIYPSDPAGCLFMTDRSKVTMGKFGVEKDLFDIYDDSVFITTNSQYGRSGTTTNDLEGIGGGNKFPTGLYGGGPTRQIKLYDKGEEKIYGYDKMRKKNLVSMSNLNCEEDSKNANKSQTTTCGSLPQPNYLSTNVTNSTTQALVSRHSNASTKQSVVHTELSVVRNRPLINPFDPKYSSMRATSNRRRWTHIYPPETVNKFSDKRNISGGSFATAPLKGAAKAFKITDDKSSTNYIPSNFEKTDAVTLNSGKISDGSSQRSSSQSSPIKSVGKGLKNVMSTLRSNMTMVDATHVRSSPSKSVKNKVISSKRRLISFSDIKEETTEDMSANNNTSTICETESENIFSALIHPGDHHEQQTTIPTPTLEEAQNYSNMMSNLVISSSSGFSPTSFLAVTVTPPSTNSSLGRLSSGVQRSVVGEMTGYHYQSSAGGTVDWKSLVSPASLPITTDYFPNKSVFLRDYVVNEYEINPSEIISLMDKIPSQTQVNQHFLTTRQVFEELISQRLSQGFQLIVPSSGGGVYDDNNMLAACLDQLTHMNVNNRESSYRGPQHDSKSEDNDHMSNMYWLSIGQIFHRIMLSTDEKKIWVVKFRPRFGDIYADDGGSPPFNQSSSSQNFGFDSAQSSFMPQVSEANVVPASERKSTKAKNLTRFDLKRSSLDMHAQMNNVASLQWSYLHSSSFGTTHPVSYKYRFRTPDTTYSSGYQLSWCHFKRDKLENFNWSVVDFHVCTRGDPEYPLSENLKYWRLRMFFIPIAPYVTVTKKILDGINHSDGMSMGDAIRADIYPVSCEVNQSVKTIDNSFSRIVESCFNKLRRVVPNEKVCLFCMDDDNKKDNHKDVSKFHLDILISRMMSKCVNCGLTFVIPSCQTSSVSLKNNVARRIPPQLPPNTFLSSTAVDWLRKQEEGNENITIQQSVHIFQSMLDSNRIRHASSLFPDIHPNVANLSKFIVGHVFYCVVDSKANSSVGDGFPVYTDYDSFSNDWVEIEFKWDVSQLNNSDKDCKFKSALIDPDGHGKSDRSEWAHLVYHSTFSRELAFQISLTWLVASGCTITELVHLWRRKAQTIGPNNSTATTSFSLMPGPKDPFALAISPSSDPIRGPIYIETMVSSSIAAALSSYSSSSSSSCTPSGTSESDLWMEFRCFIARKFGFISYHNCSVEDGKFAASSDETGCENEASGVRMRNKSGVSVTQDNVIFTTTPSFSDQDKKFIHSTANMFLLVAHSYSISKSKRFGGIQGIDELEKKFVTGRDVGRHHRTDYLSNSNEQSSANSSLSWSVIPSVPDKEGDVVHNNTHQMRSGFIWSWNFLISKRWKSTSSSSVATGDIPFMDYMLADFRNFCSNVDSRLDDAWSDFILLRQNEIV